MSATINMTPELVDYVQRVGVREHPVLAECRAETARALPDWKGMQIAPEQGAFLSMFVQAVGAKRILEIGVFTGYSSLAMALALPADGTILACDVSEDYTSIARTFWAKAGVVDKIDLRIAPAGETLQKALEGGAAGSFDLAFIDADKTGYDQYYEQALELVRPGAVIAFDNMLWSGSVINPDNNTDDTKAIRALNEKIHADERVDCCLATIGDGVMFARKR